MGIGYGKLTKIKLSLNKLRTMFQSYRRESITLHFKLINWFFKTMVLLVSNHLNNESIFFDLGR